MAAANPQSYAAQTPLYFRKTGKPRSRKTTAKITARREKSSERSALEKPVAPLTARIRLP
jgi:hypothetical protein